MKQRHRQNKRKEINVGTDPQNKMTSLASRWIVKGYWWVTGLLVVFLVAYETYDFSHQQNHVINIIESIVFLTLILIIWSLLFSLAQGIRNQKRIIRILDAKHKLSMEFSGYYDWDELVDQIARFPASLAPVSQACLFISNEISREFALAAQWTGDVESPAQECSEEACQECMGNGTDKEPAFRKCDAETSSDATDAQAEKYCLLIKDDQRLLAVLQFTLEIGKSLTNKQVDIFQSIGDDLAVALKAGQDRKVLADLRSSETALAERRSVSHYLHDHLGQNLGYLHLKMDQLLTEKNELSLEKVLSDLELMRDAAFESYGIVRGVLEAMHPETTQTLTNLLLEHARKISQRADIDIDFKTKGKPYLLPEETQSAIFYAFEESLNNVEKHAQANKVAILAEWKTDLFSLMISDNGVGFNPRFVNTHQHFGLEILNERMARVNGRINLLTLEDSGTVVSILVPTTPTSGQLGAGA